MRIWRMEAKRTKAEGKLNQKEGKEEANVEPEPEEESSKEGGSEEKETGKIPKWRVRRKEERRAE